MPLSKETKTNDRVAPLVLDLNDQKRTNMDQFMFIWVLQVPPTHFSGPVSKSWRCEVVSVQVDEGRIHFQIDRTATTTHPRDVFLEFQNYVHFTCHQKFLSTPKKKKFNFLLIRRTNGMIVHAFLTIGTDKNGSLTNQLPINPSELFATSAVWGGGKLLDNSSKIF